MPTTDQATPSPRPTAWTADHVRDRLVEAAEIERRLPGLGTRRLRSPWPAEVKHSWQDMVHWDDTRDRVLDQWEKAKGAYAYEITRMEEAQAWLLWLPKVDHQYLEAWAACTARNLSVRAMLDKRGWKRTTFYRTIKHATVIIADRLNKQGVAVR